MLDCALIGLMALVGLWFWLGLISLFGVAAMTLIALAWMQSGQMQLRPLLIAGGCFWLDHDVVGQAWIALAADIGGLITGVLELLALYVRVNIEWRPRAVAPSA